VALETLPQEEPDRFLAIARIVRPQGRWGEVAAEVLTDFPARFRDLRRAFLENPGQAPDPVAVERVWPHKGRVVLKFSGVDSIESASRLRGRHVLIPREERTPLPPHHYYLWELKGCRVVTERKGAQSEIGTVTDVERTGGVDLLHVVPARRRRREVLIPLAQSICTRIDTQAKTIVVDPPEDLLELNERS
jgi:16S rRNA processing protein RimM